MKFIAENIEAVSADGKWEVRVGEKLIIAKVVKWVPHEEDSD